MLNPNETAMIVEHMQNDFCERGGALYIDEVESILENVKRALKKARDSGVTVVFTKDWHRKDDPEFKIWPEHCVKDTWGSDIIEILSKKEDEYEVKGRRYSSFYATDLDLFLRELGIKNVVILGVMANICVLHTTADASMLGYRTIVLSDCVKSPSPYEEKYALYHMKNVFNTEIITSDRLKFD
ncbi:MAG: cysteine hydrolase [Candidatus Methanoliparum thermophilum]|uniref:Cysteine hydrolase n=1 Tax=Methanoliparum thermophilum TaxID=2491083 RepID=A0A520KR98_METT2|nr:isochorismatase family cysteine hydrolase [Candidatus Methanoliparum sp. LAM-1]RZN64136.1 MAG: cysteine hydrolase [Candidatus Methanoliparum thermophilum]BDC35600.1 isochorismatase [Candidatus Methanoliparum sp. LAM-1]